MTDDWQKAYQPRKKGPEEQPEEPADSCSCAGAGDGAACPGESAACASCPAAKEKDAEGGCSKSCAGCPSAQGQQTDQAREMSARQKRLEETEAQIDHEILVLSGKGGVGKSTVSVNLAWSLALRNSNWVGLLDADLHGPTIPLMMGLKNERALSHNNKILPVPVMSTLKVMSMGFLLEDPTTPVIWRGAIRANAIRQLISDVDWGHLDYLVVDLPPGTGDEALTIAQSFPNADGAIVVTTPQEASLEDCRKAINFIRQVKMPVLGVVENMSGFVCPHCAHEVDIFSKGGGAQMAKEMGVPFLGRVPLVPEVVAMGDAGRPLVGSDAPEAIREAFEGIAEKLLEQIGGSPVAP
ncbi:MAG: Mrp/NBP35 family ATP-binding protein [Armatimonadia bacterium]